MEINILGLKGYLYKEIYMNKSDAIARKLKSIVEFNKLSGAHLIDLNSTAGLHETEKNVQIEIVMYFRNKYIVMAGEDEVDVPEDMVTEIVNETISSFKEKFDQINYPTLFSVGYDDLYNGMVSDMENYIELSELNSQSQVKQFEFGDIRITETGWSVLLMGEK